MGAADAGRATASRVLDEGISVVVYSGGSREIFDTDPNSTETKIYLTKRRGFVRLAMRHGADLVPVFVFGEKRCYRRLNVPVGFETGYSGRSRSRSSSSGDGDSRGIPWRRRNVRVRRAHPDRSRTRGG